MRQIKTTTTDNLFQSILYPISALCYIPFCSFTLECWTMSSHFEICVRRLRFPRDLSAPMCSLEWGWHLGSFSSRGYLSAPAILWWWGGSRAHQDTHGWRLSLALQPFPSKISFDELGCHEHRFLNIPSYLPALFGNFK